MLPVSEEVHPDASRRIDRRINEAFDDIVEGARRIHAGPAYGSIEVHGFNVDPRDATRERIPSIRFPGTDAQYQEVLDKSNEATLRKSYQRRTRLEVKLNKLETKIRCLEALERRNLATRLLNLETLAMTFPGPAKP